MAPPNNPRRMSLPMLNDIALSPEEIVTKTERWPLFWRYIRWGALMAGTVGAATIAARWMGR